MTDPKKIPVQYEFGWERRQGSAQYDGETGVLTMQINRGGPVHELLSGTIEAIGEVRALSFAWTPPHQVMGPDPRATFLLHRLDGEIAGLDRPGDNAALRRAELEALRGMVQMFADLSANPNILHDPYLNALRNVFLTSTIRPLLKAWRYDG